MSFKKTNFGSLALFGNNTINVVFDNKVVIFQPPNLKTYFLDLEFETFMLILRQKLEDFNKNVASLGFISENKYDMICGLIKVEYELETIKKYIKLIFPNIDIVGTELMCDNIPLDASEYDILIDMLLVSCGEKSYKDFMNFLETGVISNSEESDLLKKKLKENEEKVKKAKNKKKKEEETNKKGIQYDEVILAILYEFPSLSISDIYSMNVYTLLYFWNYVPLVSSNKIQTIAAGNGLSKKFTYFIN